MDRKQAEQVGGQAGTWAGIVSGARIGAALPIPLVGPFAGAVVGGIIGSEAGRRLGTAVLKGGEAFVSSLRQTDDPPGPGAPPVRGVPNPGD